MADYTDLPNSAVTVGGIPSGTTVTALRDNPIAITEGAAGAPRIQTDAIEDSAVTNAKVANSSIGAEKFQTGITEYVWVGARIAANPFNGVGAHVFAENGTGSTLDSGDLASGSNLRPSSESTSRPGVSSNISGTWRCMGYAPNNEATLFVRIA